MKKTTKIIACFIAILSYFLVACTNNNHIVDDGGENGYNVYGFYYKHFDYSTKYNATQHIERIKEITEKYFNYEIKCGALLSFEMFNVYSISWHEEPTNFCIELTWLNFNAYFTGKNDKNYEEPNVYSFIMGSIDKDKYYVDFLRSAPREFAGKSFYTFSGIRNMNKKLYFTNNQGGQDGVNGWHFLYEENGIYNSAVFNLAQEYVLEQPKYEYIQITKDELKSYYYNRWRLVVPFDGYYTN